MKIPYDGYKSLTNLVSTAILPLSLHAPGFFCHLVQLMKTAIKNYIMQHL